MVTDITTAPTPYIIQRGPFIRPLFANFILSHLSIPEKSIQKTAIIIHIPKTSSFPPYHLFYTKDIIIVF